MNTVENKHLENTNTEVAQIIREEPPHQESNIVDTILFSNIINLIIVIAFLAWIFRKYNVFSFITKKHDEIVEKIKNVEEERKYKKNQLQLTKAKVKNVNQEVMKIIDEGERIARDLSERILKDAEKEAADMQKKAHNLIESERKQAADDIIQETTHAAFIIAEEHIKQAIDENMHKKYIDRFINNLENIKV